MRSRLEVFEPRTPGLSDLGSIPWGPFPVNKKHLNIQAPPRTAKKRCSSSEEEHFFLGFPEHARFGNLPIWGFLE